MPRPRRTSVLRTVVASVAKSTIAVTAIDSTIVAGCEGHHKRESVSSPSYFDANMVMDGATAGN